MYYLIKTGKLYLITEELLPDDTVVYEDESLALVQAAKKIAQKTGVVKLV